MLKLLLWSWISIPFFDLISPAVSTYPASYKFKAYGLMIIYLLILLISLVVGINIWPKKIRRKTTVDSYLSFKLIKTLTYLCLFGLISLAIDKVIIQGIDYSNGIAMAKYQLIENAEERDTPSSIFSILGYLLLGLCYWNVAFMGIDLGNFANRKVIYTYLLFNVFIVFATSFLSGGRTSIILLITFFISAITIRKILNLRINFFTKKAKIIASGLGIVTFGFIVYVFGSRAASNNVEPVVYAETAILFLEGYPTPFFYALTSLPPTISSVVYLSLIVVIYYVHSIWIFEGTLLSNDTIGDATFIGLKNILSKVGLTDKPIPWEFSGKFISWPGAVFHDYGFLGVVIISLLHGLFLGIAVLQIKRLNFSYTFLFVLLFSVALTAPFIVYLDLMMLPSIIVGLMIIFIAKNMEKIRFRFR